MSADEIGRRILQSVQDNQSNPGTTVHDSLIAEKTGLPVQDVQDHLDLLEEAGKVQLAKTTGGYGVWLTARGRLGLRAEPEIESARGVTTMPSESIERLILAVVNDGQGSNVSDSQIAEKTGLDVQIVRDHLDLLKEKDVLILSKASLSDGSRSARLKARGRMALRKIPTVAEPANLRHPVEIQDSLARLRRDHPDEAKVVFIMMKSGQTGLHEKVVKGIRSALAPSGITGLRADDKQYHDELFNNVLTYISGCGLGIAVFERIENDDFNPNVSLEVGYMMALGKPICLLKDKTLGSLHTDLVGKLYRPFDPQVPVGSIPPALRQWLADKNLA